MVSGLVRALVWCAVCVRYDIRLVSCGVSCGVPCSVFGVWCGMVYGMMRGVFGAMVYAV